jgi:hypothetical protein
MRYAASLLGDGHRLTVKITTEAGCYGQTLALNSSEPHRAGVQDFIRKLELLASRVS